MADKARGKARDKAGGDIEKRDDTQRRRVADRIMHKNPRLNEVLLDSLPHPAMIIRKDRMILAANRIAKQLGAKVGGYCWQSFGQSEFIGEQDKQYIKKHKEVPAGGTCCSFCMADEALEKQTHTNNPEIKAWEKIWDTHWTALDEETYLRYSIDVTHISREDEKLRMSELKYRSLAQNIPGLVYRLLVKQDNRMVFFNTMLESMTGFNESELEKGEICSVEPHILAEDRDKVTKAVKHARDAREPFEVEYRFEHKNGDIKWFKEIGRPIFGPDDELLFIDGIITDITERKQVENRVVGLNRLKEDLLTPGDLHAKLKCITDGVVEIFDADFARIWITKHGDLCDSGCVHASINEGPQVCRHRESCLHLMSSSGRYTHTDGKGHQRVPFGYYKIGRVAAGDRTKFLTNDVTHDPEVHDHAWAGKLDLVSFAGYRLLSDAGKPIGVMALFSKRALSPSEDMLLENLANTAAQVIQTSGSEDALRESEEKFRLTFENAKDAIFWGDTKTGLIINCNKAAEELLEKNREEIIGIPQIELHPPKKAEYYSSMFRRHIEHKIPAGEEAEIITKSGKIKPVHIAASVTLVEGQPIIQGIFRDISEQKEAEEAVKKSEANYRTIFDTANDAIFVHDMETGAILDANDRMTEMWGYTREEVRNLSVEDISSGKQPFTQQDAVEWIKKAANGTPQVIQWHCRHKNGQLFWAEVSLKRAKIGDNYRLLAIIRDVSDRKEAEEKLTGSERRFRTLVEHLPAITYIAALDDTTKTVSGSSEK
jgi:PAS domain S-box-containing protein